MLKIFNLVKSLILVSIKKKKNGKPIPKQGCLTLNQAIVQQNVTKNGIFREYFKQKTQDASQ